MRMDSGTRRFLYVAKPSVFLFSMHDTTNNPYRRTVERTFFLSFKRIKVVAPHYPSLAICNRKFPSEPLSYDTRYNMIQLLLYQLLLTRRLCLFEPGSCRRPFERWFWQPQSATGENPRGGSNSGIGSPKLCTFEEAYDFDRFGLN